MYFIKYKPLKEKLSNRTVSEREALPYLVVFTALTALAVGVPLYDNYNSLDGIAAGLSVLFAIFGILFAYKQNGKNEGFDLIQKYVVLGWVTSVRFILVSIPLTVIFSFVSDHLGLSMEETNGLDFAFWIGFESLLYYRIGVHIRDTRGAIKAE
jgi:predicted membrane channel-forming protein YqfA (hemolysin III family)